MNKGGLIIKKQEMTRIWVDDKFVPVTIVRLVPQEIVRYKTMETDGYVAAVVAAGKKVLNKEKGMKESYTFMAEFKVNDEFIQKYSAGIALDVSILEGVESVDLSAISKGKGFQGVIRRHHFAGGPATHGSKFHRLPGSIGNRKPRRVNKGHPLPGHMGLDKVTIKNVAIIDRFEIDGVQLLALKGSLPGAYNGFAKLNIR